MEQETVVRSIGVCGFSRENLEQLLTFAKVLLLDCALHPLNISFYLYSGLRESI